MDKEEVVMQPSLGWGTSPPQCLQCDAAPGQGHEYPGLLDSAQAEEKHEMELRFYMQTYERSGHRSGVQAETERAPQGQDGTEDQQT